MCSGSLAPPGAPCASPPFPLCGVVRSVRGLARDGAARAKLAGAFTLAFSVAAHWGPEQENTEDLEQWVDDWDAQDVDDEFCAKLRAELQRNQA